MDPELVEHLAGILSETHGNQPSADRLLDRIKFPRGFRPTNTSGFGDYWAGILGQLHKGRLPTAGGTDAILVLIEAALIDFPHNHELGLARLQLSEPAIRVITQETLTQQNQPRALPGSQANPQAGPSILVIGANPRDRNAVRTNREYAIIQDCLNEPSAATRLILHPAELATRPDQVIELLLRYQPTVLHFTGHGHSEAGINAVILENAEGDSWPLEAEVLADYLGIVNAEHRVVEAVVLNACATHGVADVIAPLVDLVVATDQAIDDDLALGFARGFYRGLARGSTADVLMAWGRADARIGVPGGAARGGNGSNIPRAAIDPNTYRSWPAERELLREIRIPRRP
jgi:hypothetical protein